MARYRLKIAYDGTDFHGWQIQKPPDRPPLRTVQGAVSEAVSRVVAAPVVVQGASRTDAGVHALGQVGHFDAESMRVPVERLAMAVNARLDQDVEVLEAARTRDDFESISDAIDKRYRYRFWVSKRRPLQRRHQVYAPRHDLDAERMNQAAERLVGEHDFDPFASSHHNRLTTVRTIFSASVERREVEGGLEVHFVVTGDGFLYNMVRICAGTLQEIGRGHWPVDRIDEIFRTGDRSLAGPNLPASGLCLEQIRYPDD